MKIGQEGIRNSATFKKADVTNWLKIAKIGQEGIRNSATFKKADVINWLKIAKIGLEGIRNSATFRKADVTNWLKISRIVAEFLIPSWPIFANLRGSNSKKKILCVLMLCSSSLVRC